MDMESTKARIIKANYLLQNKVGMGPVDEKKVKKSQKVLDENTIDFAPMAMEYLEELATAITEAKSVLENGTDNHQDTIQKMVEPVMQLKANGSMFEFQLVSALANIMLNFLENIPSIDQNVIEIIEAHEKTLHVIIKNNMRGDGGAFGTELVSEIKDACKRYFSKISEKGHPVDDPDAFFIDG